MSNNKKKRLEKDFVPPKPPKKLEKIEKGFVPPSTPKKPPAKPSDEKK